MYTKTEYDRYSALLQELGITDEAQISSVLDFVYRFAVIATDEYQEKVIWEEKRSQPQASPTGQVGTRESQSSGQE